ncbi:hypothetical protein CsSME_00002059 [Camellia sinensis var. sinensis]
MRKDSSNAQIPKGYSLDFSIGNPIRFFLLVKSLGKGGTDGSWRKEDGSAGIASICYNGTCEPISQRATKLYLPSVFAAEATACQQAIQWATEQNLLNICICTDSQCIQGQ